MINGNEKYITKSDLFDTLRATRNTDFRDELLETAWNITQTIGITNRTHDYLLIRKDALLEYVSSANNNHECIDANITIKGHSYLIDLFD